jgi:hypothetical protein
MEPNQSSISELAGEIRRANNLFEKFVHDRSDWKIPLRNGLLAGLGGAIGATILFSLLVWLIKPFDRWDILGPSGKQIARPTAQEKAK